MKVSKKTELLNVFKKTITLSKTPNKASLKLYCGIKSNKPHNYFGYLEDDEIIKFEINRCNVFVELEDDKKVFAKYDYTEYSYWDSLS